MEYIEAEFEITPFREEYADILVAETEDLGFESYMTEDPCLKAYIPKEKFSEPNLKTVLSAFDSAEFSVKYSLRLIPEQNWNAVWEASFEPVVIDGKCTVKASFHKGLPRTKYTITIDPKMAFGTGHHQTTLLMIRTLLEMEKEVRGKRLLDMGCGTGILSILAAKMKAALPVHAVDIDPTAVRSARENAHRNRVDGKVKSLCGDASIIQAGQYDIILANINRNILLEDMSIYARSLHPGGTLILSGFYEQDIVMIEKEAQKNGLSPVSYKKEEDWVAVKFVH